jgi:hypothetical protein
VLRHKKQKPRSFIISRGTKQEHYRYISLRGVGRAPYQLNAAAGRPEVYFVSAVSAGTTVTFESRRIRSTCCK